MNEITEFRVRIQFSFSNSTTDIILGEAVLICYFTSLRYPVLESTFIVFRNAPWEYKSIGNQKEIETHVP